VCVCVSVSVSVPPFSISNPIGTGSENEQKFQRLADDHAAADQKVIDGLGLVKIRVSFENPFYLTEIRRDMEKAKNASTSVCRAFEHDDIDRETFRMSSLLDRLRWWMCWKRTMTKWTLIMRLSKEKIWLFASTTRAVMRV